MSAFTQLGFAVKTQAPTSGTTPHTTVEWEHTQMRQITPNTMLWHSSCTKLKDQFNHQQKATEPAPSRQDMHLTNAQQQ